MDSYRRYITVTPHDSNNIGPGDYLSDAILVGGAGNIVLVFEDNTTLTLSGVAANAILPFRVKRVNNTNTTATLIKALHRL